VSGSLLPVATVATSLLAGLLIFPLHEHDVRARSALNLIAAVVKLLLVGVML
jgi:multicomponent Na+:H+ antiporter subunit D